jgi:ATP-dependent helicase/nuclease subunit B
VQGWLEISHEPGRHLILCGMNEGSVPARGGGEPWLVEGSRKLLGLLPDATRAARDAYLFRAMLEARRDGGRVDVVCGKSGAGGESLLPSRLLLAGTRDELPGRVTQLFREVEPPEAGLRWHADWIWQTRAAAPPVKLGVTSLTDYLACPFRYYLKHVVKMQASDTARGEWNARDFGNVAHTVLERWGRDLTAREFEKTEAIYAWLSAELDRVVAEWFGKRVPLAVRIQTENLRQRLQWFARKQAVNCVEGWQVHDVERAVEIPFGEVTIMARIDRIDRHRDSGRLRVLDYKTGAVDGVEKAHRSQVSASTKLPNHVPPDCPVIHSAGRRGKPASVRWINLQLPLYAVALVGNGEPLPEPSYFTLGSTEADVGIQCWTDFDEVDLAAARDCAEWVVGKIAARTFWPPAEKVRYDDFAALTAGRPLEEMFAEPPAGGAQAGPRTLPLSQGGHSGSFRQRYPPHS